MATTTSGASSPDSVEALKKVKATENEWESRLASARRETETTLAELTAQATAAVKEAQAEADRVRTERVVQARNETAVEAETILTEGRSAAESAARGEGRRPAEKKDAILDVVLGSFEQD